MEPLFHAIDTTPIIDHHAHNLLLPQEKQTKELISITTEAAGGAIVHAKSTLSHIRAVNQLASVLGCKADWESVQAAIKEREKEPDDAWAKRCFEGIETVLIDDGLDRETVQTWDWHHRLTRSECKRIVRIERVAEGLLEQVIQERRAKGIDLLKDSESIYTEWLDEFHEAIEDSIKDPNVVGFKSVICYRTGLAIQPFGHFQTAVDEAKAGKSPDPTEVAFKRILSTKSWLRLEDEFMSPFLVHLVAKAISASTGGRKPLQFHTGLGDNDITLALSSPSHMQSFIEEYPELPIVLLHASYPFTKESGYLASVYGNVYLDIGEVFPFVSQDGQETVIRESLELCPSQKLCWSTDGHWFPETYILAVMQIREGLKKVLQDYVSRKALSIQQAIQIVEDIFFKTSNKLYNLGLTLRPLMTTYWPKPITSKEKIPNSHLFYQFLSENPSVKYLRVQWLDYTALPRCRILPIKQAIKMVESQKPPQITKASLGLLQHDAMVPGCSTAIGEYQLIPIFSSLRLGHRKGYATVQGEFHEFDGSEDPIDPRTALRRVVERAATKGITFKFGFEVEIVFLRYKVVDNQYVYDSPALNRGHSWSAFGALRDEEIMTVLEEIHDTLERAGIELLMVHPESAPGQYEFISGPLPVLDAVDTLIATKEIICAAAEAHGFRATCIPKPVPNTCGTGAHMHMSMEPEDIHTSFYAGVLKHMRGICAFTMSGDSSYERVADGVWSGGTWVTWGTQNREAPLRKCEGSHWELKISDGLANWYLAVAAVLACGLAGVEAGEKMVWKDCTKDPASLDESERKALGLKERIPRSLKEALLAAKNDGELIEALGSEAVSMYLGVKEAEKEMLDGMGKEERRKWLIERY